MKTAWNFEYCVSVFNRELELLQQISAAQNKVRQAVISREWADFDEKTAEVNSLGGEFTLLEGERTRLFSALQAASGAPVSASQAAVKKPFYALIAGLPWEESRELARLYRELKMETLKMKAASESFLAYLNEARTLAAAYLEAVCPARGGKLYTRRGSKVSQDLRSIVFNSRF